MKIPKMRRSYKAENNPFYGKNHTQEAKEKNRSAHFGKKHSNETKKKMSLAKIGRRLTKKHIDNAARARRGIKYRPCSKEARIRYREAQLKLVKEGRHPHYKGGITPLTKQIRNCFFYRQWRSDIFTRDDFTCVLCFKRGGYLEVDHYPKSFSSILTEYKIKTFEEAINCIELWNINNGRTLCKKCHWFITWKK